VTPIERERIAARGEIRSSLYAAGAREGVPRSVMAAMIRAYSHAIDFQRDLHPGDKFEVLYDQPTAHDGTPVGQGVIIYAAIQLGAKVLPLYRVTFGDGTVDYFDERGKSVKRALLRTPVDGARMTSGFGMRMHPLLGYSKMHQGVDFGAPTGTPIFAAGSGVVEESGWKGSYGKFVLLRHNGRLETAYAHMSRYARGVYPGARVNQGDVIGFVGTTGRSTGAHLHFEVRVDRHQINPLSVNMPTGRVLEGQALAQFKRGQTRIRQEFSTLLGKEDAPAAQAEEAPLPQPLPAQKVSAPAQPAADQNKKI
jgi:murein DD-endopeptidase MepM/ murein hydrolase activator NlpD